MFMPFAVGSIAMIYSAIHSISIVNRTRYKLKDFKHPYSPWKDEQSDPTSYRAYKAQENQREWLVYTRVRVPRSGVHSLWQHTLAGHAVFVESRYPWRVQAAEVGVDTGRAGPAHFALHYGAAGGGRVAVAVAAGGGGASWQHCAAGPVDRGHALAAEEGCVRTSILSLKVEKPRGGVAHILCPIGGPGQRALRR